MITRDLVHEFEVHQFACDASDLYDAVPAMRHMWPRMISTDMGNGMPFMQRTSYRDEDGDIVWVRYAQANGIITLKIFND